jgi:hypothetical protein
VSCPVAQLAVFQDYLVNLTNNPWGGQCLGSSRTRSNTGGKITTFKLGHSALKEKKLDYSSRLDVVEIARVA